MTKLQFGMILFGWWVSGLVSCHPVEQLKVISVADFREFVTATGYVTDNESYGWSVEMVTTQTAQVSNKFWNSTDCVHCPVRYVSWNDAMAYCAWANVRLPTEIEYWILVENDKRPIQISSDRVIPDANVKGNVWDWSADTLGNEARILGGSFLCNVTTCKGYLPETIKWLERSTGASNTGFAVLPK